MQLYEYMVISNFSLGNETDAQNWLNNFGAQGWEMCGVTSIGPSHWYYFKRPLGAK